MSYALRISRMFLSLPLIASMIFCLGCSSDSSNPAGPSDNHGNNGTVTVIETKSSKVDNQGGTIALTSGIKVVIPSGALTSSETITVAKVDPKSYFDGGSNRIVVSCEGAPSGGFAAPVELVVPLPETITEADSSYVFAGLIDETTGAFSMEPCTVRMVEGKPEAVIQTAHFSSRFIEWLTGPTPPENGGILSVPYFNQGESQYCWATSVQMVTAAARFDKGFQITDIIGSMGVDEGGITAFTFRFSPTLSGIVNNRTGLRPDRGTWDFINYGQMKNYLKREIGINKRPVALFNGIWEHAVVVVGYNGDTFYIHDPASVTKSAIGYTEKPWTDIVKGMSMSSNLVTLVVPTQENNTTGTEVTLNISNKAFSFIKPAIGGSKSQKYVFNWDNTETVGYSFKQLSGDKVRPLPGECQSFEGSIIELYNSSQSASHTVSVWYDIYAGKDGKNHYSYHQTYTLAPNSSTTSQLPQISVDEFRWNDKNATEYFMSVQAREGSTVLDEESIAFTIASEEVKITGATPSTGGRGAEITVKGSGFGDIQKNAYLTFNNKKIEIEKEKWSNGQVTFRIPKDAVIGSNTYTITNGAVESNKMVFVVTDTETQSGSTPRAINYIGRSMTLTSNWSITGAGIISEYLPDDYGYYFKVKANVPARISLDIAYNEKFSYYDSDHYKVNGVEYYYRNSFSNVRLAPMPAGYEDADDPHDVVRINGGHFPMTLSSSGPNNYTIDFTLNNYVSWQRIQLLVWVLYDETETKYMVTEAGDVAQETRSWTEQSFWAYSYLIDINQDILGKPVMK